MEPTEIDLEDLSYDELLFIATELDIPDLDLLSEDGLVEIFKEQGVNPTDYFPADELSHFGEDVSPDFEEYEIEMNDLLFGDIPFFPTKSVERSSSKEVLNLINYECNPNIPKISELYLLCWYTRPLLLNILTKETKFCLDESVELEISIDKGDQIDGRYLSGWELLEGKSKCKKINYEIIPIKSIHIHYESENKYEIGHLTTLIIDHINKEIEYFEPNGPNTSWLAVIENMLIQELKIGYPDYKFIRSYDICLKSIQSGPLCAMYTMLYIWLRVKEPWRKRERIAKSMLLNGQKGATFLVYKLMCVFYDMIQKYQLQNIQDRYNKIKFLINQSGLILDSEKLKQIDNLYFNLDLQGLRKVYFDLLKHKEKYSEFDNISGFDQTEQYGLISMFEENQL